MLRNALFWFLFIGFYGWAQTFQPFPKNHNRLVQGIGFSSDEKVLYMTLPHKERLQVMEYPNIEDAPKLAIYQSKRKKEGWGEPSILSFSGKYKDYEPTVSPKGDMLLFNSNRPLHGNQTHVKNNIWYSKFENDEWRQPHYLYKINTPEEEQSYPTLSKEGKLIYTAELNENGKSIFVLFETVFEGSDTNKGTRIQFPSFNQNASDPWVSPKGDYLIFTAFDTEDWQNTCDLYISFYRKGKWTVPMRIKELNSTGPDFSPTVSSNGKWIYYRKNYEFQKQCFRKLLNKYKKINSYR